MDNDWLIDLVKDGIVNLVTGLAEFFSSEDLQLDQDSEINIDEISSGALDEEFSALPEQNLLTHDDTSSLEQMRFGESSDEVQQYEYSLNHAKSEVDSDRISVSREQAEVDHTRNRLNVLSDQISHEPNEDLRNSYQSEMSSVELELTSHEQKLEQARADLAVHQNAEHDAEDKLIEALNNND